MEFDKTTVAIRERSQIEILDLSLHVCRKHAWPLLVTMAMGALPMALIDAGLLVWMLDYNRQDFSEWELFWRAIRYVWLLSLLVFIQAPLASAFATTYLGKSVFRQRPRMGEVIRETFRYAPALLWNQVLLRAVGPATLAALLIDRQAGYNVGVELLLIPALAIYAALVRALRPFMNEIILLEKNPIRSRRPNEVSIGKRSANLHGPSGGDLFTRFLGSASVAIVMTGSIYGGIRFLSGIMLNDWWEGLFPGGWQATIGLPLAMWLTTAYFAVARYLSYLDLRIRHEGWEVELRLRAEAARLHQRLSKAG